MDSLKFKEGDVVFHKATGYKCVVIMVNSDHMVMVRTEKDEEKTYYPQELKTLEEELQENRNILGTDDSNGFGS